MGPDISEHLAVPRVDAGSVPGGNSHLGREHLMGEFIHAEIR